MTRMNDAIHHFLGILGPGAPVALSLFFFLSSALMIWRLNILEERGFQGTTMGALFMPYFTGFPNLIFAIIILQTGASGKSVIENCIVNNVTNLTLLIGVPTVLWGMAIVPHKKKNKKGKEGQAQVEHLLNRLSITLSLLAGLFFTGALWALGRDGTLTKSDGYVLTGLFVFWQAFNIYEVKKNNLTQKKKICWRIYLDLAIIGIGAFGVYLSVEHLVQSIESLGQDFFGTAGIGWITGWLMVLPNAILAIYYTRRGRTDIAYSSQIGDGHICIPLCIGIFASFQAIDFPPAMIMGIQIIALSSATHMAFLLLFGRIPRLIGFALIASYGFFVYNGLIQ